MPLPEMYREEVHLERACSSKIQFYSWGFPNRMEHLSPFTQEDLANLQQANGCVFLRLHPRMTSVVLFGVPLKPNPKKGGTKQKGGVTNVGVNKNHGPKE